MNDIEKHVLQLIGESTTSPDVFADTATGIAPVRDSINDAIQELCMLTGAYKRTYLLPLYAERQFYRMNWANNYFGWVVECWDRNKRLRLTQTDLIRIRKDDPWWLKWNGDPTQYIQIGIDIVGFNRKPSANGLTLELECVCIPKPYTDENSPIKVREIFQRAAVYMATSEYYASRGDAKRAVEYFDKYLETAGLMSMKPATQERQYQFKGKEQ